MAFFKHNGHRVFYRLQGKGPLFLILPGNTATSASYQSELNYFSEKYTTVAIDFIGTGQSDREDIWPVEWWARNTHYVSALIAYLSMGPAIIMGTSGGGITALWTAINFPAQVECVIADSVPYRFSPALVKILLKERLNPGSEMIRFYRQAQGDDWQQVIAADNAMLRQFVEINKDNIFGNRLHEIRCPVLITGSRQDVHLPELFKTHAEMARAIRHGRLYIAPQGGHPFMWTGAKEFRAQVDAFLRSI